MALLFFHVILCDTPQKSRSKILIVVHFNEDNSSELIAEFVLQLVFQLRLDNLFISAAVNTPQVSVVGCALESLEFLEPLLFAWEVISIATGKSHHN